MSSWIARRNGQVVGIDPAANQLKTASRLEEQYQLGIEFVENFCEALPFPNSCFDFAISEYGASLWANPFRWIPEASRVLKTGGRLVFMTDHAFAVCCVPDDGNWRAPMSERPLRTYHGPFKHQWNSSPHEVEFHLSQGDWVQLLRDNNFVIERLLEVAATAKSSSRFGYADANCASKWPAEEVWSVRLSA